MSGWDGYKIPAGPPMKPVVAVEPGVLGRSFNWCEKPDCERLVYTGVLHCCTACSTAAKYKCEIEEHDDTCNTKWAERKNLLQVGRFGGQIK